MKLLYVTFIVSCFAVLPTMYKKYYVDKKQIMFFKIVMNHYKELLVQTPKGFLKISYH